jgi:uncharacterized FlaG/YvyC family protein
MKVHDTVRNVSYDEIKLKDNSLKITPLNIDFDNASDKRVVNDVVDIKRSVETVNYKVNYTFNQHNKKVSVDVIDKETSLIKKIKPENIPDNFQKICDVEVFNTFLNSTYTKVSPLNDGEYKIYTDVKGVGGARGVRELRERRNEIFNEIIEQAEESGELDNMNSREVKSWATQVWDKITDLGWDIFKYAIGAVVSWVVTTVLGSCSLI